MNRSRSEAAAGWAALGGFWRAEPLWMGVGAALLAAATLFGLLLLGIGAAWAGAAASNVALTGLLASRGAAPLFALLRSGARYAERLASHEATLRLLARLRGALFREIARRPWPRLLRVRRGPALSRITADVDALDGLSIRVATPVAVAASLVVLTLFAAALAALIPPPWGGPGLAAGLAAATLVLLAAAASAFARGWREGRAPIRRRAAALEAARTRFVDLQAAKSDLAAAGRLADQRRAIEEAGGRAGDAANALRRADAAIGFELAVAGHAAVAAAFVVAAVVSRGEPQAGLLHPLLAAIAAFGLIEGLAPLRRAALETGRVALAARRAGSAAAGLGRPDGVVAAPAAAARSVRIAPPPGARSWTLTFDGVRAAADAGAPLGPPVSFTVAPGEVVALTGPSGVGKSALLAVAAGLTPARAGVARLGGAPIGLWSEDALRAGVRLLTQRVELVAGDVRENLLLACDEDAPDDAALWRALEAAEAADVVRRAGGLEAPIAEGGVGFSGGETRRIALARALVGAPKVALLDEPTEGLDAETARRALRGALGALREAAVVLVSHRAEDRAAAHRVVELAPMSVLHGSDIKTRDR